MMAVGTMQKVTGPTAPHLLAKPPLTEEDKKLFAANPYPLRGTGSEYLDPFEAVVPPDDWEVNRAVVEG